MPQFASSFSAALQIKSNNNTNLLDAGSVSGSTDCAENIDAESASSGDEEDNLLIDVEGCKRLLQSLSEILSEQANKDNVNFVQRFIASQERNRVPLKESIVQEREQQPSATWKLQSHPAAMFYQS